MMGYGHAGEVSSRLLVQERRKILTEAGKELAEVAIAHSDTVRLGGFPGPDGAAGRPGELHSSRKLRSVTFPPASVGSVLAVDYEGPAGPRRSTAPCSRRSATTCPG